MGIPENEKKKKSKLAVWQLENTYSLVQGRQIHQQV